MKVALRCWKPRYPRPATDNRPPDIARGVGDVVLTDAGIIFHHVQLVVLANGKVHIRLPHVPIETPEGIVRQQFSDFVDDDAYAAFAAAVWEAVRELHPEYRTMTITPEMVHTLRAHNRREHLAHAPIN